MASFRAFAILVLIAVSGAGPMAASLCGARCDAARSAVRSHHCAERGEGRTWAAPVACPVPAIAEPPASPSAVVGVPADASARSGPIVPVQADSRAARERGDALRAVGPAPPLILRV